MPRPRPVSSLPSVGEPRAAAPPRLAQRRPQWRGRADALRRCSPLRWRPSDSAQADGRVAGETSPPAAAEAGPAPSSARAAAAFPALAPRGGVGGGWAHGRPLVRVRRCRPLRPRLVVRLPARCRREAGAGSCHSSARLQLRPRRRRGASARRPALRARPEGALVLGSVGGAGAAFLAAVARGRLRGRRRKLERRRCSRTAQRGLGNSE
mmetsp:Transcript_15386/g.49411  ORF Transcript_15386/g.49411 Transcript_15386/m.49411 type:complete len:209 (+) Transcript_15386:306-932(+)